jgi:hypothetical protein
MPEEVFLNLGPRKKDPLSNGIDASHAGNNLIEAWILNQSINICLHEKWGYPLKYKV